MVLYFTGTGNSAFAAHRIADLIQDECVDLFDKLKNKDYREMKSEKPFVIVSPTYGWKIPRLLEQWIRKTPLQGNEKIYFAMTCGGDIGNAGRYLEKLCGQKKMKFMGCAEIVMPENYIAMFSVPDEKEAAAIVRKALPIMDKTAKLIRAGKKLPDRKCSTADYLKSGAVNAAFYPVIVHARKFYVKDNCIGCGKCAKVCPLNNIRMVKEKPVWEDHCTHCMACICKCPKAAIEYGKKSQGKPRYQCPKLY